MGAATSIRAEPPRIATGARGAPLSLVALTIGGGPLLLAWWVATGRPGSPLLAVLVAAALVVVTALGLPIFSALRIRVEARGLRFGYASLAGRTETPRCRCIRAPRSRRTNTTACSTSWAADRDGGRAGAGTTPSASSGAAWRSRRTARATGWRAPTPKS